MRTKNVIAGAIGMYGVLSLLSVFRIPLFLSLPINAFGINVGQLVVAIICILIAYYMIRK